MGSSPDRRYGLWMTVVAVVLVAWGIAGIFDRRQFGRGDFTYMPDYQVLHLRPEGAAAQAGMQAGDRVVSVAGIPVEDLPLYSRWPRSLAPRVGESLSIVVEREGETLPLEVVYGPIPAGNLKLVMGATFVGLAFLVFGLWPLLTVGTPHALLLAASGLVLGLAFFGGGGPYLGTWDGLASHLLPAGLMLWSILMLRFFLTFPRPKRLSKNPVVASAVYTPLIVFLGCLVLELIMHPVLYHTFGWLGSLLILIYCLLALAALVHTVVTLSRAERRETGVNLILGGVVVAILAVLVPVLGPALVPALQVPGIGYLALLVAAFPLAMALAVRRESRLLDATGMDQGTVGARGAWQDSLPRRRRKPGS
jgi:hypothetical protein